MDTQPATMNTATAAESENRCVESCVQISKSYQKPILLLLNDLRSVTLGASQGTAIDSTGFLRDG